jgi:hypothetical protein
MLGRGHGRLRLARIDDNDFGTMFVPTDPLPHDRMRNARIRAHKDQHIGFFKILVGVRRRVEPERLFVSRRRRGHALTRVAVAM